MRKSRPVGHKQMQKISSFLFAIAMIIMQQLEAQTNDFYDDAETIKLTTS